ncbi:GNAT family N-acetyltransferase [Streptomyces caniferus]|uniref:GNAT family N-acetyltransferase n=1 Tax=Streptomyces caniferus TaxID=285557 RepID=UPI00381C00D1
MPSIPASSPWPTTLSTARLLLRPAESTDVREFTRLWTDPEVRRFLGGPVAEQKLPLYQQRFANRPHTFAVTTREDRTVLGSVLIDPAPRFGDRREVSYGFLPEHWGRGYAREAVAAVVEWAFGNVPSDHPSVIAVTQEANARSCRLLEAIGMRRIDSFIEFDAPQVLFSVDRQGLGIAQ